MKIYESKEGKSRRLFLLLKRSGERGVFAPLNNKYGVDVNINLKKLGGKTLRKIGLNVKDLSFYDVKYIGRNTIPFIRLKLLWFLFKKLYF